MSQLFFQDNHMKFHPSVFLFFLSLLMVMPLSSQTTSTLEKRMADFVNNYLSQYTNYHMQDFNDPEIIKTHKIKSIKTYSTNCVDASAERLQQSCFYDSLGRLVEQCGSESSIADRVTYKYNSSGQLEEKKIFSTTESASPRGHLERQYTFSYDEQGKLVKIATIEMLDELPHDHGAHYFSEMAFYSSDTILYDFKSLKIIVQHREANRYQALTTENAPVQISYTTTLIFDANGKILQKKFDDDNRKIYVTDNYTDCWSFITTSQLKNVLMDSCQWLKNVQPQRLEVPTRYNSLDSVFFEENEESFIKYTYTDTVSSRSGSLDHSYPNSPQKNILIYDMNKVLRVHERHVFLDGEVGWSQQLFYNGSAKLIKDITYSSANWDDKFGIERFLSSLVPDPVEKYRVITYEYFENGIVKMIKMSGRDESYASCVETVIEYY